MVEYDGSEQFAAAHGSIGSLYDRLRFHRPDQDPQGETTMRVLTRSDVESLLTIEDAIDAVEDGFRQLALGNVQMPQRLATTIPPHNGLHLSMPAFVDREPGTLTTKIITVYPDNPAKHLMPMIQGVLDALRRRKR